MRPAQPSSSTLLLLVVAGLLALQAPHASSRPTAAAAAVPMLVATPAILSDDGESLRLSWQRSFVPAAGDSVLLSCGARSHPLDYLGKGGNLTVNASSHSVHTAALINMRCDYTAAFVRAGKVLAQLLIPLAPGLANAPSQGHIAFGDRDDQMHVLWVSASTALATVRFSTSPSSDGGVPQVATGSSGTYTASMMCSAPANQTGQQFFIDPGLMHRVLLQGLQPDTDYWYSFGNERDGWGDERRFRSKPSSRRAPATGGAWSIPLRQPCSLGSADVHRAYTA